MQTAERRVVAFQKNLQHSALAFEQRPVLGQVRDDGKEGHKCL
jgi:hypothetical protein